MGINLSNVSNGSGNGANGAGDLDKLKGMLGAERFRLPSPQERTSLAATGKFLNVYHSTTGPLQNDDPRSFVGHIKYVGSMQYMLRTEVKNCSSADADWKDKVQARETKLFSFQDAAGNTGFMIRHGKNSVVLTGVTTREQARDLLDAIFLPNYIGSPAWIKEGQGRALGDQAVYVSRPSVEAALIRASFPVRQSFTVQDGCGGGC